MKNAVIVTTAVLLVLNIIAGLVFSSFRPFNVVFTSLIIVITGLLLYLLRVVRMKDAFAISLSFLFIFLGIVEYIMGALSPDRFQNNSVLFVSILLIAAEALIIYICSSISKRVD